MQHVYQSPAFFTGSAAAPLRTVRRADCQLSKYAHLSLTAVLTKLGTQHQGLSFTEVLNRLMKQGLNRITVKKGSAPDLAAYAKLMSQQSCMVRRQNPVAGHEGSYQGKVSASLLVPGDMVLLGAGDWVPADVRIISQDNLVLERMVLQAWPDSCAMGDKVIAGTAQAVVVATGEHTLLSLLMQMPQQQQRTAQEHHSLLTNWRHSLLRVLGSCAAMLVAGGLALHSAASHAETELSLYGTLDTGMSWTRISGQGHRTGLEEGGQTDSLWGLRGQEDLGGGTYANFRLEGGINLLTGSAAEPDRLFNYQSWLGLSNEQWGELRFGRQYTVGQEFVSELEIAGWKDFGMGALMRASDNYQVSSAATWISPEWSGFQLGVTHSRDVGERDWEKNRKQVYSVAGRYENGPWQVATSYERLQRVSVDGDKARAPQALQVALSYDFGSVRLATAWSRQQNGFVGRNGEEGPASLESIGLDGLGPEEFVKGGRLDTWYLGAAVELGGGEVQMQWAFGKPNWTWEDTGSKARKMQVMSLGYVYPLSPRTSLYAFAAHGKHYDPENVVTAAEPHSNRVAVGLTHHF